MTNSKLELPRIASRTEWLAARKDLLKLEKESTRQRDLLNAERRNLPMVAVDEPYVFEGSNGPVRLLDLFEGRRQLLIYHFMFDPSWEEGCKSCSHLMDNAAGSIIHLAARDTSFAVVSRAPISKIEPFRKRMGWTFPFLSASNNRFNYDFHVTIDPEQGDYQYNYEDAGVLLAARKVWFAKGELPGLSAFIRDGSQVFHTYSTYQRGLDLFLNTYNFLDQTALGRHEEDAPGQSWIRHHDRYESNAGLTAIAPAIRNSEAAAVGVASR